MSDNVILSFLFCFRHTE